MNKETLENAWLNMEGDEYFQFLLNHLNQFYLNNDTEMANYVVMLLMREINK